MVEEEVLVDPHDHKRREGSKRQIRFQSKYKLGMWPVKAQITSSSHVRINPTESEFQVSESFHFLVAYDLVKTTYFSLTLTLV